MNAKDSGGSPTQATGQIKRIEELEAALVHAWDALAEVFIHTERTPAFIRLDRELRRLGLLPKVTP